VTSIANCGLPLSRLLGRELQATLQFFEDLQSLWVRDRSGHRVSLAYRAFDGVVHGYASYTRELFHQAHRARIQFDGYGLTVSIHVSTSNVPQILRSDND
jgi:hypothetical protein